MIHGLYTLLVHSTAMAPLFSFPPHQINFPQKQEQPQPRTPPDFLHHYFPSSQYFSPSSAPSLSPSPSLPPPSLTPLTMVPFNPLLLPRFAAGKRGRLPTEEQKNGYSTSKNKNISSGSSRNSNSNRSSGYYRTSLSRVITERERRKFLGDSIATLKELLPVRCRSATPQMDKCTVLKEAHKHILDLREELQDLAKKKEELVIMRENAAKLQYVNGPESAMVEEAASAISGSKKEHMMECSKRSGAMFHNVVCNASNMFVTLRTLEGGGVRLSRVLGAIEKANVDVGNAVASWTDSGHSFSFMAHGKVSKPASVLCLMAYILLLSDFIKETLNA